MPNKYHSDINGRASAPKPPSERSGGQASYKSESTYAWKADIGPVGRRRNTVGFAEVKQAAKQHMADDYGLPISNLPPVPPLPMVGPGASLSGPISQPAMPGPGPIPGVVPQPMPEGGLRPYGMFPGSGPGPRRRRRGGGYGGNNSGREGY